MLWGTDSIWYGSPQDQIQAFRTFQIAPELRERHGYPEITPALRAKIFGLNALKIYPIEPEVVKRHVTQDQVARQREEYRERPDPAFVTYGPKTAAQLAVAARLGRIADARQRPSQARCRAAIVARRRARARARTMARCPRFVRIDSRASPAMVRFCRRSTPALPPTMIAPMPAAPGNVHAARATRAARLRAPVRASVPQSAPAFLD